MRTKAFVKFTNINELQLIKFNLFKKNIKENKYSD